MTARAWFTVFWLFLLGGCSPLYVLRAGYEEARILSRRQPIERLVRDPATPEAERAKLALVLQARRFAADSLGLKARDSYTTFSRLDSDTLALVVSAAYPDRFEAYTWWFPIVGHVPYKGFFSEGAARKEMRALEKRGLDTSLRPTSAFSTLGWFNDPLVSPLLRYDSVQLANTVTHELFHNTFYASGQAQFNESAANFVGGRGAIEFFCGREGPQGPHCRAARAEWVDELRFGAFLDSLVRELEALYARPNLSSADKVRMRQEVFLRGKERFRNEVQPRLLASTFDGFLRQPINNATLIGRRLYYHRLELFERVYRRYGSDLRRTIAAIVGAAEGADDPYAALSALAGGATEPVPPPPASPESPPESPRSRPAPR